MTKSTVSLGEKRARGGDCATSLPPVQFGIVFAEWSLESRVMLEPEQVPSGVVTITAPRRQRKHADDGVEPRHLEERRHLDFAEQLVLLGCGQAGKACCSHP